MEDRIGHLLRFLGLPVVELPQTEIDGERGRAKAETVETHAEPHAPKHERAFEESTVERFEANPFLMEEPATQLAEETPLPAEIRESEIGEKLEAKAEEK